LPVSFLAPSDRRLSAVRSYRSWLFALNICCSLTVSGGPT